MNEPSKATYVLGWRFWAACFTSDHVLYFPSLQFIREYTGKVDELVKDRIEAKNEEKAKENEEKDVIKQQVYSIYSVDSNNY